MMARPGWDLYPLCPQPYKDDLIRLYFKGSGYINAATVKELAEVLIEEKGLKFKPRCLEYEGHDWLQPLSSNFFGLYTIYISDIDFTRLKRLQGFEASASMHVNYHDPRKASKLHYLMLWSEFKRRCRGAKFGGENVDEWFSRSDSGTVTVLSASSVSQVSNRSAGQANLMRLSATEVISLYLG